MHPWHCIAAVLLVLGGGGCAGEDDNPFHPEPPGFNDPPLDEEVFVAEVLPVLNGRGCSSIHCHGSGNQSFSLTGGADPRLDYLNAANQVSFEDPVASRLLRKPLAEAAGGLPHNAPTIFDTTADPDYQTLARWVGAATDSAPRGVGR